MPRIDPASRLSTGSFSPRAITSDRSHQIPSYPTTLPQSTCKNTHRISPMSDIANHDDSRYSTPEEWSRSTSYSEFCDDNVIRSAADPIQPTDATSRDSDHFAAECSSSIPPSSSTSTAIGKRKSPDESVLSDRPSASYKRRTISTGIPIDIGSLAPPESSSGTTLRVATPPLSNDTLTGPVEGGHHHHDAVGPEPEPFIIVGIVRRFFFPIREPHRDLTGEQAHNTSVKQAMDTRGLPWGVQWEIARLISLGHCSWNDISMQALDFLRTEGLSPPDHPDSHTSTPAAVLNARIAPYIEDFFRWNRHTFGSQSLSKEILATVRSPVSLPPPRNPVIVIHTNLCHATACH